MLQLTIAQSDTEIQSVPDLKDPGVLVFRADDGRVCAYSQISDGQYWMHWPGLASFHFDSHQEEVKALAHPSARPEWIIDVYRRSVFPMVLHVVGAEILHSSAIFTASGVVA